MNYRSLTADETALMERHGCTADGWDGVRVAEGFDAGIIYNVRFEGQVRLGARGDIRRRSFGIRDAHIISSVIGDGCRIENVGIIDGCHISDHCSIESVGRIAGGSIGRFCRIRRVSDIELDRYHGLKTNDIAVMCEGGRAAVTLSTLTTSNIAALQLTYRNNSGVWQAIRRMVEDKDLGQTRIDDRAEISDTRRIEHCVIGAGTVVEGASLLSDTVVGGGREARAFIGHDVICRDCVVAAGAHITDGARLYSCLAGEACRIGRGFTAENSVFFANSHMYNGEACAAFCGPFSVSHHKASLLIGGMFSFFNAGSATNFSNHAYKMGPLHYGRLARGSKTASGAHLLWPARTGPFTMCMGKIVTHPDTADMPFSYLIGTGRTTLLVPAVNITTAGTLRDIRKWPARDERGDDCRRDITDTDAMSPLVMQHVIAGRRTLASLVSRQPDDGDSYAWGGCMIRRDAALRGIGLYDMLIKMFFAKAIERYGEERPYEGADTRRWTDLGGMTVPEEAVTRLAGEIRSGNITDIGELERRLAAIHDGYDDSCRDFACREMKQYYGLSSVNAGDRQHILGEGRTARAAWLDAVAADARKEYNLGDVDDDMLDNFIKSLHEQ